MIPDSFTTQTLFTNSEIKVEVLRLDLIHPEISGNKWFKLKYNLEEAKRLGQNTLLTFGGAFSNHIAATAVAAAQLGFKSIGVIRGEKKAELNPTLIKAREYGMQLHFTDRATYQQNHRPETIAELKEKFGDLYVIPEGGSNDLGIMGCKEISESFPEHQYLMCACGTGTTFTGLVVGKQTQQVVLGINVLKGKNQMLQSIQHALGRLAVHQANTIKGNEALNEPVLQNSFVTDRYAFSGYAAYDPVLVKFKNRFEHDFAIPLDYIYTNKLAYACFDLLSKNKFKKGSSILLIHSGGLQGNESFEKRYHIQPMR